MKLLNKIILIISPESWSAHSVSKHHYAITLASQNNQVYFLNPPDENISDIEIKQTKYKNLSTITDKRVAKGLRFYPKFLREIIIKRWLEKVEKIIKDKFDIIWLFENSRFYDMGFAGDRLKIYHQVDLNQNFHVAEASLSADICFGTTDYIIKEIVKYNKKAYKIHHGVALSDTTKKLSKEQKERFRDKEINVTYIGNLGMKYIDVELLANVVNSFPDIQFQFVGGYRDSDPLYKLCKSVTNIVWWGKVESELIPSILSLSNVVLVSYQTKHSIDQASPHKIMEYLASGKVVVSTYTDEYKDKRELLEMVDNSKDYLYRFESVINNLDFYNSKENQKVRVAFAQNHSYPHQLKKIMNLIDENNLRNL